MRKKPIRLRICLHCQKEYSITRSDQKFCNPNCKSSHHTMFHRKRKIKQEVAVVPQILTVMPWENNEVKTPIKDLALNAAGSAVPIIGNEGIKKIMGHHNSDIMKLLKEMNEDLIKQKDQIEQLKAVIETKNSQIATALGEIKSLLGNGGNLIFGAIGSVQ